VPKQVCHFGSLSRFRLGFKTTSRRAAARRLIVLHPEQSIDSELKMTNLLEFVRQNCIKMQQSKNAVRQVKS